MSDDVLWSVALAEFADGADEEVLALQKELVMYTFSLIVQRSPVDTGAFRGNHRVSVGAVDEASDPALADKAGTDTIAAAAATLEHLAPFTTVYIQNNLPYATALEEGHSMQAPLGIYKLAVGDAEQEFS